MNTIELACFLSVLMGVVGGSAAGYGFGILGAVFGGVIGFGIAIGMVFGIDQLNRTLDRVLRNRIGMYLLFLFFLLAAAPAVSGGASFLVVEAGSRLIGLHPRR